VQNTVGYGLFCDIRYREDTSNIPAVRLLHQIHFYVYISAFCFPGYLYKAFILSLRYPISECLKSRLIQIHSVKFLPFLFVNHKTAQTGKKSFSC